MDLMTLGIGVVAGVVAGYGGSVVAAGGAKEKLEKQLRGARKELESAKASSGKGATEASKGQAQAEKALSASKGKVSKLQSALGEAETEVATLKKAAKAAKAALKNAAQDAEAAETNAQKAEEAEQSASAAGERADALDAALKKLQALHDKLKAEADTQTKQMAELKKSKAPPAAAAKNGGGDVSFAADASLEDILSSLLERSGQSSAVLADGNGIVIVAAGDGEIQEGLAAAARILAQLNTQLDGIVPLASIGGFSLTDDEAVLDGRSFEYAGDAISLVTYGQKAPGDALLDGAASALKAALD